MNTEVIVYLLRKTSLTRSEIGKLSPEQFNETLKELYYQESVDEWRKMHTIATILATIHNAGIQVKHPEFKQAGDYFSGEMPTRNPKPKDSLEKLATDRGIKLPSKELRSR
uniref:Uncharacterized protein n=1 Tax=viral metagenome TaxID=1070528 RepID=A0A6H1ZTA7_9ZZZZ